MDEKFYGFQLESSLIPQQERSSADVTAWPTNRTLVSQGTGVLTQDSRLLIGVQGLQGLSDLQIGWNWFILALCRGV